MHRVRCGSLANGRNSGQCIIAKMAWLAMATVGLTVGCRNGRKRTTVCPMPTAGGVAGLDTADLPLDDEVAELRGSLRTGSKVSHSVVACGLERDRNGSSVDPERKIDRRDRRSRT